MNTPKNATARQIAVYDIGLTYRGLPLADAWTAELSGPARVNAEAEIQAAFFEAGVLGASAPRYVTGWRFGSLPTGSSYNYRDGHPEAGVSLMQIDGEPAVETLFVLFNAAGRPRVRVGGWLISRTGSDGEPLVVGAEEI